MMLRLWLLLLCGACAWGTTVNELVDSVMAELRAGRSDAQVARSLRKVKLTESLDDRTVEELESAGTGPKSMAELQRLQGAFAEMPAPARAPAAFPEPPPPPEEESRNAIEETRRNALSYSHSLPDFICTEMVRRYEQGSAPDTWSLRDTLMVQLTYFQQKENYRLMRVNNHATSLTYRAVGGALSEGEFGSLLNLLFDPSAAAEFRWHHWTTLRKRPAYVFSYRVRVENSQYHIDVRLRDGPLETAIVGQHGWLYVDRDTRMVLKIVADADSFPERFPVRRATGVVDYDFVQIGTRNYLLPLRATTRLDAGSVRTRNELEFDSYRKFEGEATITYDVPAGMSKDRVVKH